MSDHSTRTRRRSPAQLLGGAAQTLIILTCVLYLVANALWALLLWEAITVVYLIVGSAVMWKGVQVPLGDRREARSAARWMWIPPLLAAIVGINAAITAMITQRSGAADSGDTVLMLAASAGIILSWMMLQIAFAEVYEVIALSRQESELRFPATTAPSTLDYLYFSFTIGTSFATSDVEVTGVPTRRVVLVHSIIGFFYNALVVAVAFQVFQGLITRA